MTKSKTLRHLTLEEIDLVAGGDGIVTGLVGDIPLVGPPVANAVEGLTDGILAPFRTTAVFGVKIPVPGMDEII
ncbi:hypothetical protein FZZ93_02225 [Halomonas eurihalina]|uniref:Uncharacterized protein n=1 Tax=Halomonas eurihalina TaxID=42566 RepID=A0A5D9DFE4_HALER|nr:hypothetical protein [Halomonas eurihalina]MDR5857988.1 hypothetical protein [Halomonas eurihalina]TZG41501.1 hypothetical protein FZZ93_02225 [Halomonas eurihalina]